MTTSFFRHSRFSFLKRRGVSFYVLVAFLLLIGWVFLCALVSGLFFLRAKLSFEAGLREATAFRFEEAEPSFARAGRACQRGGFVFSGLFPLRFLPAVGGSVDAVQVLSRVCVQSAEDAQYLLDVGSEVERLVGFSLATDQEALLMRSFADWPASTKHVVLERVASEAGALRTIVARMDLSLQALRRAQSRVTFPPLSTGLMHLTGGLQEATDLLSALSHLAFVLPTVAGLEKEQVIALLFLNNAELRPGGGFIGSYGIARVRDGELTSLVTYDSYTLDDAASAAGFTATPPLPLARYNAARSWFARDANWSPDFAVSSTWFASLFAQEVRSLPEARRLELALPAQVDQVIGLTPDFAEDLLTLVGPVEIDGQVFTAENIHDTLEYQVQRGFLENGTPYAQRKEILADLVQVVRQRLFQLPASSWRAVFARSAEALETKQLALFSTDQQIEQFYTDEGWGGRVLPPEHADILGVIDANLASLKTNAVIRRGIASTLAFEDGSWVSRVTITYTHDGQFDWKTTRYRSYTRLLVPEGSTLLGVQGALQEDRVQDPSGRAGSADMMSELGFTSFGAFISVEPGQSQSLTFTYRLPPSITDRFTDSSNYELFVFKQLGSHPDALTLNLNFDKNLVSASPPELTQEWGDHRYRLTTVVEGDQHFFVHF